MWISWPTGNQNHASPFHGPLSARSPLPSNQQGAIDSSAGQIVIGVTCMLLALCLAAVGGRICARRRSKVSLEADDYLAISALVFLIALSVEQFILGHYLLVIANSHGPPAPNIVERLAKLELASQLTYILLLTSARASVLFLYRRVFTLRHVYFYTIWIISAILVLGYFIAFLIGALTQCGKMPLDTLWQNPAECNYSPVGIISMGFLGAFVDFELLLVPIPMVLRLQMPVKRRAEVCGLFGLGIIGVAVSIARAVTFLKPNPFQNGGASFIVWSTTEPAVVLLCACLPSVRPLFHGVMEKVSSCRGRKKAFDTSANTFVRINDPVDGEMKPLPPSLS